MSENTITREAAAKRPGSSMRTVERTLRDSRLNAIRRAVARRVRREAAMISRDATGDFAVP